MTMDTICNYFARFEKKFESHFIHLYDDNFLTYYRISISSACTFTKGNCRAEMRKGVCYTIDIKLSNEGSVLEAQCECAAGMGRDAHCKHVAAVMYGTVMFAKNKFIKTEETCTQRLQTFHKCKSFKGSPIKSDELNLPGADELTNIAIDPKPEEFRNNPSYPHYFRNVCLNFPGISKMPIYQTFTPANMIAVAHEHDYLKLSPEDNFLEKLQITKNSDSQIENIKSATKRQSLNKTWKVERAKCLTSSVFGRICKCTDRTEKMKLSMSLTVIKNNKSNSIEHGRRHESVAIKRFEQDKLTNVQSSGLVICKEYPFLAVSPDGVINQEKLIKVKCPYVSRNKWISTSTVPYLKQTNEGKYCLDQNHDYYYQIQGQLLCTGANACIFTVCLANNLKVNDIIYIEIKRDDAFIADMINKLNNFYMEYFKQAILEKYFYKPYSESL
ncbi:uncharacterized protein LOC133176217 [Saccostrea echinata]|uniref:uncharacterized protein LOC133176217 n=1 Tax=Saccostrea echinata TaxID=191078 RepID=UPI002A7EAACA|nr:uncharacterized protein LOC133176217 [Saccostrea echinata]